MNSTIIIALALLLTACHKQPIYDVNFKSQICLSYYQGNEYNICNPIKLVINEIPFVIPKGFQADLSIIPIPLWLFISPFDPEVIKATVLHDYLYKNTCWYTKKDIDLIFYDTLLEHNTPRWRADITYYTVRLFGRHHYCEENCE
jgi:hypothetical protein